uniref:Potassium channel domain-containing protein n=1 Tax=Panagrolaimus superbus TaxID=310955 RepID=A0A914YJS5_9BILA
MTTVGYGDLVPITAGGKVVAAMASVCGIIVLAFPISMIIDKFAESTGEWYGDEFVQNMQHHRRNDPKFRSVKVSDNNNNSNSANSNSNHYYGNNIGGGSGVGGGGKEALINIIESP